MVPDDLTAGPRFAAFCERFVVHTKGRWAGRPLVLEDWQRRFWWEALEVDPATGLRVYQEVGLGLPRKNSKSTMGSAAALYMLVADGEAEPEVYIGAGAQHQANVVYGQARSMAQRSAGLAAYIPHPGRYAMECHRNGGVMRSLASDGALQHGLNPSANVVDEIHAHKSPDLYTALTTGTGARDQPFTLWITTAGESGQGILADLYGAMFQGAGELVREPGLLIYRDRAAGQLIYWWGADREADPEDPATWRVCNPASWLQDGVYLGRQLARLKSRGQWLEWRRYHLNQFVEVAETWLPAGAWDLCRGDLGLDPRRPVGIGTDRSPNGDLGAVVVAQRQGEAVVVRSLVIPPDGATGITPAAVMRDHLRAMRTEYPAAMVRDEKTRRILPGPAFGYDPTAYRESAELLEEEGLNMVEVPMTAGVMGPASTLTYELITTGRLVHDGDPVLAEHVASTMAVLTDRGMKVTRPKVGTGRANAACIALVRAVSLAMQEAPRPLTRQTAPAAMGF